MGAELTEIILTLEKKLKNKTGVIVVITIFIGNFNLN